MFKTNVEYYGVGFDSSGNRICAHICDFDPKEEKNAGKVEELLKKVKETENVTVAEIVDSDTYNKYLNGGCVRNMETGQPVDYVPPEPTAEEKAAVEKAALKFEYESNKSEMLEALQSAQLAGNADAVASIQQDYKDMTAAYKEAVEGVKIE